MKLFFDIVLLNALVCIAATITLTFNYSIMLTDFQIWAACFVPTFLFLAYRLFIVNKVWGKFLSH